MKKTEDNNAVHTEQRFLKKYVIQKIFWTIIALLLVVAINMLINKYLGRYFNDIAQKLSGNYILTGFSFFISEILIGIFPAELFMMIYQSKGWNEYIVIVLILGITTTFTESDKIKHLVKYLEDVDMLLKKQEETINSLLASGESMSNTLNSLREHVDFHDQHLKSYDQHLQSHDERLDMRK